MLRGRRIGQTRTAKDEQHPILDHHRHLLSFRVVCVHAAWEDDLTPKERVREMEDFLSVQSEPVTAENIAEQIGVSKRQVYRYMALPRIAKKCVALRKGYIFLSNLT
jgi:hypothetical protein